MVSAVRGGRQLMLAAALAAGLTAGLTGCADSPGLRDSSGDFFTHDPALVAGAEGEPWFIYSTGNGDIADGNVQIRRSTDGVDWDYAGEVWQEKPAWVTEAVPKTDNLWAPELYEHDGTWYLYYSASSFGSNLSVIGLATNTTLDPADPEYEWVDRGPVISSLGEDFNAIDPGIVEDEDGTPWMSFGSFWSGIRMVQLDWSDGKRADDATPLTLAGRNAPPNAIEAPYILNRDGFYYLFVSRDFCCQGAESTYNIAVGRSTEVTGPYLDADGVAMTDDGGTELLSTDGSRTGPGGQSVSGNYLGFHYYDRELDGAFRLGITELKWEDGWPTTTWS
ncbi:arabinan endo-1,5-alpha-L-arabinosidase [Arthrobacter sp. NPDC097144]|uniref:arabinan endo-1,5-alpha-L-arabinosidase n=1 Tax=Arthrobacter sp. NPDC097144 TaxID=3363946 RepID=UPI003818C686